MRTHSGNTGTWTLAIPAWCLASIMAGCQPLCEQAAPKSASTVAGADEGEHLCSVLVDNRYGFIDALGSVRIPPQFEDTSGFWEGMAPVRLGQRWGFIGTSGEVAIPVRFSWAYWFSEGLAAVNLGGEPDGNGYVMGGKWGYIDRNGRTLIEPQFEEASEFKCGVARVKSKGQYGVIDKTGTWVIRPPVRTNSSCFREGLLPALLDNGLFGYIDVTGKTVVAPRFALAFDFSEGLAHARLAGKEGFIDRSGHAAIPFVYDATRGFSEDLAAVNVGGTREIPPGFIINGGQWGYVDRKGEVVIPPRFEEAFEFHEGLAGVRFAEGGDHYYGFIDRHGRTVIRPHFDRIVAGFRGGMAKVVSGGKCLVIDRCGKVLSAWRNPGRAAHDAP